MRKPSAFVLSLLLITTSAIARDSIKELSISLKFVPQEGVQSSSPDLQPAMLDRTTEVRVEDGRGLTDAADIGQGTNDDDKRFIIRATSDVRAFVEETSRQVLSNWGLKITAPARRILNLRVMRFYVDESNKAVGSVYAAEVKLAYTLSDDNGRTLAQGTVGGEAHRYGRARSADNSNEVLSDALKEALASTLSEPTLQNAWISGSAGTSAKQTSKETPEERLRKLEDLYKKGLITKEEYEKKRAEILKEL